MSLLLVAGSYAPEVLDDLTVVEWYIHTAFGIMRFDFMGSGTSAFFIERIVRPLTPQVKTCLDRLGDSRLSRMFNVAKDIVYTDGSVYHDYLTTEYGRYASPESLRTRDARGIAMALAHHLASPRSEAITISDNDPLPLAA